MLVSTSVLSFEDLDVLFRPFPFGIAYFLGGRTVKNFLRVKITN